MSILFNNNTPESLNFTVIKGANKALFGSVEYKPISYNENNVTHGSTPVSIGLKLKRRDKIIIPVYIHNATSKEDAIAKLSTLNETLRGYGLFTITSLNVNFKMVYIGYTSLSFFGDKVKLNLNFAEPNPNERTQVTT